MRYVVVVLPEPDGPTSATSSPGSGLEVDALERNAGSISIAGTSPAWPLASTNASTASASTDAAATARPISSSGSWSSGPAVALCARSDGTASVG